MDLKQKLLLSPLYDWLGKRSYAQSGEDILADVELGKRKMGFYVDIGAYHPKLFSNTYLFYKRGWRGICVDPNPFLEELYAKARPEDKFLNMGVGSKEEVKEYFMFDDPAANTFSEEQAGKNTDEAGRKQMDKRMTAVLPLRKIFEKYLPSIDSKIDLLSVDAEGLDEEVLESNDWKKIVWSGFLVFACYLGLIFIDNLPLTHIDLLEPTTRTFIVSGSTRLDDREVYNYDETGNRVQPYTEPVFDYWSYDVVFSPIRADQITGNLPSNQIYVAAVELIAPDGHHLYQGIYNIAVGSDPIKYSESRGYIVVKIQYFLVSQSISVPNGNIVFNNIVDDQAIGFYAWSGYLDNTESPIRYEDFK